MTLTPGTRLGPYEVAALIGKGGTPLRDQQAAAGEPSMDDDGADDQSAP